LPVREANSPILIGASAAESGAEAEAAKVAVRRKAKARSGREERSDITKELGCSGGRTERQAQQVFNQTMRGREGGSFAFVARRSRPLTLVATGKEGGGSRVIVVNGAGDWVLLSEERDL